MSNNYLEFLRDWAKEKFKQEMAENNPLIQFLKNYCKLGYDWRHELFFVKQSKFVKAYNDSVGERGKKYTQAALTRQLKSFGFSVAQKWYRDEDHNRIRYRCYMGIRLLTDEELKQNE